MQSIHDERGFTLIEIVAVVVLLVVMISISISRVESLSGWRLNSDLRKFINTWEFLYSESLGRGEGYRLVIDLDDSRYWVRQEMRLDRNAVSNVDHVKNLRTSKEKDRRRKQEEEEELLTTEEEFKEADTKDSGPLEEIYYDYLFHDSQGDVRAAIPLEFPNLADKTGFPSGLRFRDVKLATKDVEKGQIFIRFSPHGSSDFAVVHLVAPDDQIFTVFMNPSTGSVQLASGDVKFDWLKAPDSASGVQ